MPVLDEVVMHARMLFSQERQIDYGRTLYREDLPALKERMKLSKDEQEKEDNVPRQKPPSEGLRLEFVFG